MVQDDLAQHFLERFQLKLKPSWCQAALNHLNSEATFRQMGREQQLQMLFSMFLESDLHFAGVASLPAELKVPEQTQHNTRLAGRFVLQADETVNIAAAAKERYKEALKGRCLKLHLTDGVQQVSALEYRYVSQLHLLQPAGTKVAITDANVRKGVLLLQPENVLVLGGQVDSMEAARQRMLERWHQPPGGRAHRDENQAPVDLYREAAEAAWRQPQEHADEQTRAQANAQPPQRAQNNVQQQADVQPQQQAENNLRQLGGLRPQQGAGAQTAAPARADATDHHQHAQAQHPQHQPRAEGWNPHPGADSRAFGESAAGMGPQAWLTAAMANVAYAVPANGMASAQRVTDEARPPVLPPTGARNSLSPPQWQTRISDEPNEVLSGADGALPTGGRAQTQGDAQTLGTVAQLSPQASTPGGMQLDDEFDEQASPMWYSPPSRGDVDDLPAATVNSGGPRVPETIVISDSSDSEDGADGGLGQDIVGREGRQHVSPQHVAASKRKRILESSSDEAEPALTGAGESMLRSRDTSGSMPKRSATLAPSCEDHQVPYPGPGQAMLARSGMDGPAPVRSVHGQPDKVSAATCEASHARAAANSLADDKDSSEATSETHGQNGAEMPVTSVLDLINRTATAAEDDFPVEACLHARITACKTKLTVVGAGPEQQFSLTVEITDDSMSCEVQMHHNILQDLLGMGVQELVTTADRSQPISRMQKLFKSFHGLMIVQIGDPTARPVVINLGSSDA